MITVADVAGYLESQFPLHRAAEWDNVGLLLGSRTAPVERILTCLTVTPDVAREAIAWPAQMIVTHHPVLFRAVKRLTDATAEGQMLLDLIRANVAVYCPHTSFDDCPGGINDLLAEKLNLRDIRPLRPWTADEKCKLVVFVPDGDLRRVSDAIFTAGAGVIGQYSQCSFRLQGAGTFLAGENTNPTVGEKGRHEEVSEWRLEAVCPKPAVPAVVAAMKQAHSYEEPAYDVYPLVETQTASGHGRVGTLPEPAAVGALASAIKKLLNSGPVQFVGSPDRQVHRLAVACGAAASFLEDAVRAGAEAFVTGEARFHDMLAAQASGIALVVPGHYATERFGVENLARQLSDQWPNVQTRASKMEADPANWV